jgi:hypothetical protein
MVFLIYDIFPKFAPPGPRLTRAFTGAPFYGVLKGGRKNA